MNKIHSVNENCSVATDRLVSYPADVSTIGERIRQRRMDLRYSQQELAEAARVHQTTVTYWEIGKSTPKDPVLARVAAFLKTTPEWLRYGIEKKSAPEIMGAAAPVCMVPVISWVAAGRLADTFDPSPLDESEEFVPVPSSVNTLIGLRVSGSSMNRVAEDGDIIIVDYAEKTLIDGKFFAIRHGDRATFKRYRSTPPRLEPFSTEPEHEIVFPKDGFEVVGRVVKVIKSL